LAGNRNFLFGSDSLEAYDTSGCRGKVAGAMQDELVLVAGAGGFIGGAIVAKLRRRGHKKIRAVDIKPLGGRNRRLPASPWMWPID